MGGDRGQRVAWWGDGRGKLEPSLVLLHGERGRRVVVLCLGGPPGQCSLIHILVQESFEPSDWLQVGQDLGLVKHGERAVPDGHEPICPEVHVHTVDVVEHHLDMCGGLWQN